MARKAKTKRKPAGAKKRAPAKKKARAGARKTAKRAKARKPARKRAAPRAKAAAARRTAKSAKPAKRKAPKAATAKRPAKAAPAVTVPEVPEGTERIGSVVHYYGHISVAVVRVDRGALAAGDTIRIKGHTTDFTQTADSMEIDHEMVGRVEAGQEVGLKVTQHAREHDQVYRVLATGA
jgi:hypothetical protein